MINIAICDDNSIHLQKAEQLVDAEMKRRDLQYSARLFSGAKDLLSAVDSDSYSPDIAVLDIEMDGEDGISLARRLNIVLPHCQIIFLTSYVDYAPEAYEAEHIWFVVKKTADRFFPAAMEKALLSLENSSAYVPAIITKEKGVSSVIPIDQILYISKVGRKSCVRTSDTEYYDYRKPTDLIRTDFENCFIRCHQGYWVNLKMIQKLDHQEFILKNGMRIPISRSYREDARKRFFDSILKDI